LSEFVIKFNVNLSIGSTIAYKMDFFESAYSSRMPEYHVLAIPAAPENVEFFDISVLNAEHIKEVDFEKFKEDIKNDLMKLLQ